MAIPLGKLTILVGAGILGSVLAKEGRVSDLVSGAFKVAWKQIIRNDHTPSVKKPQNDSLMAQMNNLRQELQMMASNRPVTIVTASQTGTSRYGIIIVVVVAAGGYVWWKGWKLPDLMFATRRSLSDACSSVASQLESVYSSISVTKRDISSRMDGVEHVLDESIANNARTQEEIIEIQGRTNTMSKDFREVQHAVLTLETKINRIEVKQGETANGVWKLCDYALSLENSRPVEQIQASSFSGAVPELPPASPSSLVKPQQYKRPALEAPPYSPSSTGSLPPVFELEQSRFGYNGFQKENNGILQSVGSSSRSEVSSGVRAPEGAKNAASSSGRFGFGFGFPTLNTSTILRTRSATSGMVQQKRST